MLQCKDESYYVGHTDDLEKRIAEHSNGSVKCYTQSRLPIKVVYTKDFATREEALIVERQIKGWARKKKEALIRDDWEMIKILSNQ